MGFKVSDKKMRENLRIFFEEKNLAYKMFEIEHKGKIHFIDSETVQDMILNQTPTKELDKIFNMIIQIDFRNGDINHYLEHLAKCFIMVQYGA